MIVGRNGRICSKGIWDDSIPGITFDENGVSNYAKMLLELSKIYPRDEKGLKDWLNIVDKVKELGKKCKYDCIVGVSGGTDSSYLLYLLKKEYNLRILAVNMDNGWNSEIAVNNIKKITKELDIDLFTWVIDYEEVKKVLRSYLFSSLPWVDAPTDLSINAVLYKTAINENVKFIFSGSDFRTEGKQPIEWTYIDSKQFNFIVRKLNNHKLKTYPIHSLYDLLIYKFHFKINNIRPYYFLDYKKKNAQDFLIKNFNWQYYGGHHHENKFTKFIIGYWLPVKFGIDKRKITLSAQVLFNEITREEAIELINKPAYPEDEMEKDKNYICKKLEITNEQFQRALNQKNKSIYDYPSYLPLIKKLGKFSQFLASKTYNFIPTSFIETNIRNRNNQ
jgi:N-acetyl sugar amidotransferase